MSTRVLHVVPALAPRYGGPSAATIGMCRALAACGVTTLVATTDADGRGRLPVALERPQPYAGVSVIFFRRRLSEAYKWSGRLGAWLRAHVGEFDVVHIHAVFSHSSIAAGRVCRDAGVPYIVRPLGTLDPWSVRRKRLRKRLLFQLGVQNLLIGATAMHYTSAAEQQLAESVVPGLPAGIIVPNGIDDNLFSTTNPGRSARDPYLLSLSRIDEKKGLDVLIRAFKASTRERHLVDWRLVIAGDGDPAYVQQLKTIAEEDGAEPRIVFRGWVGGDDKTALLRRASLFALPSHQENFGISVAEAMASGVPVVVTPGVNLAADIEAAGAGWVVDRDVASLSATLNDAAADPAERARRGRAGRALAERFRWPVIADELTALYRQVMAQRAPAVVGEG